MSDQRPIFDAEPITEAITAEADSLLTELNRDNLPTFLSLSDSPRVEITSEFADLCVQMRTTPRPDVMVALRQMQNVLQVLPLALIVQDPTLLTLRSLLDIAVDAQPVPPRLRCFAFGMSYLQAVPSARPADADDSAPGKKPERFSEALSELLSYFLLEPRHSHTNEQIADALWPGKEPARAQQAFHTARHRLHLFAGEEVILGIQRGHFRLNPQLPIWYDVAEFEHLVTRAPCVQNPSLRIKMLENAVDLYRGDFLEKNYKDWTGPVRAQLRTKYIGALLRLGEWYEPENAAQAILCYDKLLRADPLNEEAYVHLIALHAVRGDDIAAQRTWLLCRETFKQDMGTEPGPALVKRVQSYLAKVSKPIFAG